MYCTIYSWHIGKQNATFHAGKGNQPVIQGVRRLPTSSLAHKYWPNFLNLSVRWIWLYGSVSSVCLCKTSCYSTKFTASWQNRVPFLVSKSSTEKIMQNILILPNGEGTRVVLDAGDCRRYSLGEFGLYINNFRVNITKT